MLNEMLMDMCWLIILGDELKISSGKFVLRPEQQKVMEILFFGMRRFETLSETNKSINIL